MMSYDIRARFEIFEDNRRGHARPFLNTQAPPTLPGMTLHGRTL